MLTYTDGTNQFWEDVDSKRKLFRHRLDTITTTSTAAIDEKVASLDQTLAELQQKAIQDALKTPQFTNEYGHWNKSYTTNSLTWQPYITTTDLPNTPLEVKRSAGEVLNNINALLHNINALKARV